MRNGGGRVEHDDGAVVHERNGGLRKVALDVVHQLFAGGKSDLGIGGQLVLYHFPVRAEHELLFFEFYDVAAYGGFAGVKHVRKFFYFHAVFLSENIQYLFFAFVVRHILSSLFLIKTIIVYAAVLVNRG